MAEGAEEFSRSAAIRFFPDFIVIVLASRTFVILLMAGLLVPSLYVFGLFAELCPLLRFVYRSPLLVFSVRSRSRIRNRT
jgi:hypothetical protein